MTEQNVLISSFLDVCYRASNPHFGVSFFLKNDSIIRTALFKSTSFVCNLYGRSSLQKKIFSWIETYLEKKSSPPLPINLSSFSSFSQTSLRVIQSIPFGKTISYQEVATLVGNPKASRAIGNVCAQNLFPLIIPCHRVIGARQNLGGFAYPLEIKKNMIHFETTLSI